MSRWPTTKSGLAVSPAELGYETVPYKRGVTNNHHQYWPRAKYAEQPLLRTFRGLPLHVNTLRITQHSELHEDYDPPKTPSLNAMIDVVEEYLFMNGVIDVIRESKTNEMYQLNSEQWQNIRNGQNERTTTRYIRV